MVEYGSDRKRKKGPPHTHTQTHPHPHTHTQTHPHPHTHTHTSVCILTGNSEALRLSELLIKLIAVIPGYWQSSLITLIP